MSRFFSSIALTTLLLCTATASNASLIDLVVELGSAEQYTMAVGGANSSIILGSEAEIFGGVGANWHLALASGAKIHGNTCTASLAVGAGASVDGKKGLCGQLGQDISSANQQAALFVDHAQNLGAINETTTLSAGLSNSYTIDSLMLETGEFLTVYGNSSDKVIINILGNAKVGSGAGILLKGGLTSSNVLFNFANAGFSAFEFGGAHINGTFLADQGAFILGDGATLNDVRLYTNRIMSANVQVVRTKELVIVPDTDIVVEVPEPETFALFLAGLFFLLIRTNSKHA